MKTAIVGAALLLLGGVAVAAGILGVEDVAELVERVGPILAFVLAITVVAELAAEAGLFQAIAERLAILGRGRGLALWLLVVLLAVAATVFLSLDTAAVLLTPVVVVLAQHVRISPIPFALTTVWIANTGSLLLPVSNLTNLLAAHRLGDPGPGAFAALTWAPAVAAILVTVVIVFATRPRQILQRYTPDPPSPVEDRTLFLIAAVTVGALLPALVSGIEVWIPAAVAAVVLVVAFAFRRPAVLRWNLVPWPILVFASGLFLAMAAAHAAGLTRWLDDLVGTGTGLGDLLRVAGTGALAANAIDNLPAYLALEPFADDPVRLIALLIGVNAGAIVTPWASLAILLWHGRLTALGVELSWRRYLGLSLLAAPLVVGAATLALWLVHGT
ncbi:SLC13 family permease [Agromyces seonyuensis]|uniref:Arsenic transporter n=1 Tax=Agromyces seonyuensis TaxID=2662446 RepID=A0A6I4NVQ5_9MICO|nr:arsenic transporter [Agromyces seonyuensis]